MNSPGSCADDDSRGDLDIDIDIDTGAGAPRSPGASGKTRVATTVILLGIVSLIAEVSSESINAALPL